MTTLLADRVFLFLGFILGIVSSFLPWMKVSINVKLKTNEDVNSETSYGLFSSELKDVADAKDYLDLYNTTIAFVILTLICIASSMVLSVFPTHNFLLMKFSLALGFIFPIIGVIVWYSSKVSEDMGLILNNSAQIEYLFKIANASRFQLDASFKDTAGPILFIVASVFCFIAFVIGMFMKAPSSLIM
jgi:hypothetical protein